MNRNPLHFTPEQLIAIQGETMRHIPQTYSCAEEDHYHWLRGLPDELPDNFMEYVDWGSNIKKQEIVTEVI